MEVTVAKFLQKQVSNRDNNIGGAIATKIRQREDSGITHSVQKTKQKISAVDAIVCKVDSEFRKRDEELAALSEAVSEKERELEYCESETKKQIESTSILCSSISYRTHAAEKLEASFEVFKGHSICPLDEQFKFFRGKLIDLESFLQQCQSEIVLFHKAKTVLEIDFECLEKERVLLDSWLTDKQSQLILMQDELAALKLQTATHYSQIAAVSCNSLDVESKVARAREALDELQVRKAGSMREREEKSRALTILRDRCDLKETQAKAAEEEGNGQLAALTKRCAELAQQESEVFMQRQVLECQVRDQDSCVDELTRRLESMSADSLQNQLDIETLNESCAVVYAALLKDYHSLRDGRAYLSEKSNRLAQLQSEALSARESLARDMLVMNQRIEELNRLHEEEPRCREAVQGLRRQLNENISNLKVQVNSSNAEIEQLEVQSSQIECELKLFRDQACEQLLMASSYEKEINLLSIEHVRCTESNSTLQAEKQRLSESLRHHEQQKLRTDTEQADARSMEALVVANAQSLEQLASDVQQLRKTLEEFDGSPDAISVTTWIPSADVQREIELQVEKRLEKIKAGMSKAFDKQKQDLENSLCLLRQQKQRLLLDEEERTSKLEALRLEIFATEQRNAEKRAHLQDLAAAQHALQEDSRHLAVELMKKASPHRYSSMVKSTKFPTAAYAVSQVRSRELTNPGAQLIASTAGLHAKGHLDMPPRSLSADLPESCPNPDAAPGCDEPEKETDSSDDDISPSKFLGKAHARDPFRELPPPPMTKTRPVAAFLPGKYLRGETSTGTSIPPSRAPESQSRSQSQPQPPSTQVQPSYASDKPENNQPSLLKTLRGQVASAPSAAVNSRASEDTSDDASYMSLFLNVDCTGGGFSRAAQPLQASYSHSTVNQPRSQAANVTNSKWPVPESKPSSRFPGLEAKKPESMRIDPSVNRTATKKTEKSGLAACSRPLQAPPQPLPQAQWTGVASPQGRRREKPTIHAKVYRSSSITTKRVTHETATATHTVSALSSKGVAGQKAAGARDWFDDDDEFGFGFGIGSQLHK